MRFGRVVFGVNSSPFLLNATIDHHMRRFQEIDSSFVEKFLSSIDLDDVSLGSNDADSTYELYLKSKSRSAETGFKLRKCVINSDELCSRVKATEQITEKQKTAINIAEEDQSYAKGTLETKSSETKGRHNILQSNGILYRMLSHSILEMSHTTWRIQSPQRGMW